MNFLPGPVNLSREIAECFLEEPVSHRRSEFNDLYCKTTALLELLSNANNAAIVCGSGTLTNDIVGFQLKSLAAKGIILVSGEFGNRLTDHARRIGLNYDEYKSSPGQIVNLTSIRVTPDIKWLWTVHCETSTGCIYNLDLLKKFCAKHNLRLALDCVSSIAMANIDLSGVYLATASSGKGLGSLAGLGIIFYNEVLRSHDNSIPRYLDLSNYLDKNKVPFTLPWNQLKALQLATSYVIKSNKPGRILDLDRILRKNLAKFKIKILAEPNCAAPGVLTIVIAKPSSSFRIGQALEQQGYELYYNNKYLLQHNWLQICLMNEHSRESITKLVCKLESVLEHAIEV